MRRIAPVLIILGLLFGGTACTETNKAIDKAQEEANSAVEKAKDVKWDAYPNKLQRKLENYAAKDNCNGLNGELDKLDPGKDTALVAYIKALIADAGCA